MKELSKAIHSLSDEKRNALIARLQLKSRSESALVAILMSYTGIHEILSTLDETELKVLKAIYTSDDGATFGELEKELKLKVTDITRMTDAISPLCLIYVLKNRQLISNKLDKAYAIKEIAESLKIYGGDEIKQHLIDLSKTLLTGHRGKVQELSLADEESRRIFTFISQNGFIVTMNDARGVASRAHFEAGLNRLVSEKYIRIFHTITPQFQTFLAVDSHAAPQALELAKGISLGNKITVNNRIFFLNNLLAAYDSVTTFGLFLTKQLEFRKIDIKRISDSMITLKNLQALSPGREKVARFALYVLNKLGCLKLRKDTAFLSLTEIQKDLDNPLRLLSRVLKVLRNPKPENPFFPSPFEIPPSDMLDTGMHIMSEQPEIPFHRFTIISYLISAGTSGNDSVTEIISGYKNYLELVKKIAELFCLLGIIEIRKGVLFLADIGEEAIAAKNNKPPRDFEVPESPRTVYINPDFTMLIPLDEIDSKSLYWLMSYVQIMKHDVIIHAQITKESIVKARKRGMQLKRFLEVLAAHAKNEIPQNMKFLINEWSRQTIDLSISSVILLKTTHPSLIDEMVVGRMKNCVIDRVSDTCAIIPKDCIDDIVKMARKKDAVITLFEGDDSED